jgi:hypothetical protein
MNPKAVFAPTATMTKSRRLRVAGPNWSILCSWRASSCLGRTGAQLSSTLLLGRARKSVHTLKNTFLSSKKNAKSIVRRQALPRATPVPNKRFLSQKRFASSSLQRNCRQWIPPRLLNTHMIWNARRKVSRLRLN